MMTRLVMDAYRSCDASHEALIPNRIAVSLFALGVVVGFGGCAGDKAAPRADADSESELVEIEGDFGDAEIPSGDIDIDGTEPGGVLTLNVGPVELRIHTADGRFDVVERGDDRSLPGGPGGLYGLHFAAETMVGKVRTLFTSLGRPLACDPPTEAATFATVRCRADVAGYFRVEATFTVRPYTEPITVETRFVRTRAAVADGESGAQEGNAGEGPTFSRLFPFRLSADDGGWAYLGQNPVTTRILQNGSDELVDFFVALYPGNTPLSDPASNGLLVDRSSYSSGNLCAFDGVDGGTLLAGFTRQEWAIPLVSLAAPPSPPEGDGPGRVAGRAAFTHFAGELRFPVPTAIPLGTEIDGGAALLHFTRRGPHTALEEYASAIAQAQEIRLPPRPTSGWDSWYTGIKEHDLSAAIIREEATKLSELFGPWGLDGMQIDDGWQDTWGDWNAKPLFAPGMDATARDIKAQGLTPELWIAPFSAHAESAFFQAQPAEAFLPKSTYGRFLIPSQQQAFDLRRPDMMARVAELGTRVRAWGYPSVKMDFAYFFLLSVLPPHPTDTNVALYRRALRTFREALGRDTYLINISMAAANYGLVDAFRIGLDDWPCWEGGAQCAPKYPSAQGISAQGIQPAVRMAARRYWMNGRVWWNHQDQIFFRDLTIEEARAVATLFALSGGMFSLGERAGSLNAAQIEVYRRLLPLTGRTARPLDLFTREFPEVWRLSPLEPLASELDPSVGAVVLALFHWGRNADLSQEPAVERPDGAAVLHQVPLLDIGFPPGTALIGYDLWNDAFIQYPPPRAPAGSSESVFLRELEPHTVNVMRLRPRPDVPAFLGTDRHILMGEGFVSEVAWDAAQRQISGQVRSTPGAAQRLLFYVPAGFTAQRVEVEGVGMDGHRVRNDGLLEVSFTGTDGNWHRFTVGF